MVGLILNDFLRWLMDLDSSVKHDLDSSVKHDLNLALATA